NHQYHPLSLSHAYRVQVVQSFVGVFLCVFCTFRPFTIQINQLAPLQVPNPSTLVADPRPKGVGDKPIHQSAAPPVDPLASIRSLYLIVQKCVFVSHHASVTMHSVLIRRFHDQNGITYKLLLSDILCVRRRFLI
ncbi:AAEL013909-PA, partial [Aedes aegypti]